MARYGHRQRGVFMFALVLVLLMLGATVLLMNAGTVVATIGLRTSETQTTLSRLSDALIHYAQVYQRLPCPANPNLATTDPLAGYPNQDSVLTNAHAVCTYDTGVVPWKVLGLKAEDAVDEWNQLISYRVYHGAVGLTQSEGASRIDCDTTNFNAASGTETPETPPIDGRCAPDHNTRSASFISHADYGVKGLGVSDYGSLITQVAYVLISHGASGLGAYLQSGARNALPGNTATDYPNTQSTAATFVNTAASDPAIAAGAAGHFDDLLKYVRIDDLLRFAKLDARDWPEPPILGINPLTTTAMDTAGTDHLLTQDLPGTREFQATNSGYAVSFGNIAGPAYSSCLWSPNVIPLFATTPTAIDNVLAAYVEAAFDYTDAGGGLVLGILPGVTTSGTFSISNDTCGGSSNGGLGWTNAGMGVTLPSPRFGIEIDLHHDNSQWDPPANHVAVDRVGVWHDGNEAATCNAGTGYSGTSCYTGPSATYLMNGLNHFHRMRVEVEPRSSSCGSTAPRLKFWLLPEAVCPSTLAVVSGTTWSGAIVFRTQVPYRFGIGTTITVTGVNPSGYNGNYTVLATPTEITFTVAKAVDPGNWVAGGTISPSDSTLTLLSNSNWNADGTVTFSTTAAHTLIAGNQVVVTDVTPADYNGTYTVTGTTPTTFTVSFASDPGITGSGGLVVPKDCTDIQDMDQRYAPTSFPTGGVQLAQCIPTPAPANAFDSIYFGFTSNNIVSSTPGFNLTLRNLLSGLIPVP